MDDEKNLHGPEHLRTQFPPIHSTGPSAIRMSIRTLPSINQMELFVLSHHHLHHNHHPEASTDRWLSLSVIRYILFFMYFIYLAISLLKTLSVHHSLKNHRYFKK